MKQSEIIEKALRDMEEAFKSLQQRHAQALIYEACEHDWKVTQGFIYDDRKCTKCGKEETCP